MNSTTNELEHIEPFGGIDMTSSSTLKWATVDKTVNGCDMPQEGPPHCLVNDQRNSHEKNLINPVTVVNDSKLESQKDKESATTSREKTSLELLEGHSADLGVVRLIEESSLSMIDQQEEIFVDKLLNSRNEFKIYKTSYRLLSRNRYRMYRMNLGINKDGCKAVIGAGEVIDVRYFVERLVNILEGIDAIMVDDSFQTILKKGLVLSEQFRNGFTVEDVYNVVSECSDILHIQFPASFLSSELTVIQSLVCEYLNGYMQRVFICDFSEHTLDCEGVLTEILKIRKIDVLFDRGLDPRFIIDSFLELFNKATTTVVFLSFRMIIARSMLDISFAQDAYEDVEETTSVEMYRNLLCTLFRQCFKPTSQLNGNQGSFTNTDDLWEEIHALMVGGWLFMGLLLHEGFDFLVNLFGGLGCFESLLDFMVQYDIYNLLSFILLVFMFIVCAACVAQILWLGVRAVLFLFQTVVHPVRRCVVPSIQSAMTVSCSVYNGVVTIVRRTLTNVIFCSGLIILVCIVLFGGQLLVSSLVILSEKEFVSYCLPFLKLISFEALWLLSAYYKLYFFFKIVFRAYIFMKLYRLLFLRLVKFIYDTFSFFISILMVKCSFLLSAFLNEVLVGLDFRRDFIGALFFLAGILWVWICGVYGETLHADIDSLLDAEDIVDKLPVLFRNLTQVFLNHTFFHMQRSGPGGPYSKKHVRSRFERSEKKVDPEKFERRRPNKDERSCPYEHSNRSCPENCFYRHGVAQSICFEFLRGRCNNKRCGWAHVEDWDFSDTDVFNEENFDGSENGAPEPETFEVIFQFTSRNGQEYNMASQNFIIDGLGREVQPHNDGVTYRIQDPFLYGPRRSKDYGLAVCYYDKDVMLGPFIKETEIESFHMGVVNYEKCRLQYCVPWLENLISRFGNVGFDLKNQHAILTFLDRTYKGSVDILKQHTAIAFLYRQHKMYQSVPPPASSIVKFVIQDRLDVLSCVEMGSTEYTNTCEKKADYKYNGLFMIDKAKGFQFRYIGYGRRALNFSAIGNGLDIEIYPKFDTTNELPKARPNFCGFYGKNPWVYYSRTGENAAAALPRLFAAREGEEYLNNAQASLIAPNYVTLPEIEDFLQLCESHYVFRGNTGIVVSDRTKAQVVCDQGNNKNPIPLDWVREMIDTLTSVPRIILCWLALSYYFSQFLAGKLWEVIEICFTNLFGFLDTNTMLHIQTELPTPKRALYILWAEEFKVLWSLFFGTFITELKVKDEVAKYNGYPRLFGSLDGAVLAGRGVADFSKLLFSGLGFLPSIKIQDYRYEFCDCQDRQTSDTFFNRLLMPTGNSFYFYSDDSLFKFVVDGDVYIFESDISKCDMSNRVAIFYYVYILIRRIFGKTIADGIVKQAHSMARLVNPSNKSEYVNLIPHFFFEYSGLIITTLLNNMASMFIAMSVFNQYEDHKDEISGKDDKVDRLMDIILKGARDVGYNLTVQYCASPSKATFLKRITDGQYSTKCLGVLLRTFGTMEEYCPAALGLTRREFESLTHEQRFEIYGRNRVNEHKNDPGNLVLDALRYRFKVEGCSDNFNNDVLKERYPNVSDPGWARLVEIIRNLRIGDQVSCEATVEIFRVDYGVE